MENAERVFFFFLINTRFFLPTRLVVGSVWTYIRGGGQVAWKKIHPSPRKRTDHNIIIIVACNSFFARKTIHFGDERNYEHN
jgi:hypothetical protein